MAHGRFTAFADTTEQIVYAARCALTGVFVTNPAATATDGWIALYDASGGSHANDSAFQHA